MLHACWINKDIDTLAGYIGTLILAAACFEFQGVDKFRTTLDLFSSYVGDYITRDVMKCALTILGRNLNRCTDIHIEMNDQLRLHVGTDLIYTSCRQPCTHPPHTIHTHRDIAMPWQGNMTPQSCIATHQLGLNLVLSNRIAYHVVILYARVWVEGYCIIDLQGQVGWVGGWVEQ